MLEMIAAKRVLGRKRSNHGFHGWARIRENAESFLIRVHPCNPWLNLFFLRGCGVKG
jgi:hypothetical protein